MLVRVRMSALITVAFLGLLTADALGAKKYYDPNDVAIVSIADAERVLKTYEGTVAPLHEQLEVLQNKWNKTSDEFRSMDFEQVTERGQLNAEVTRLDKEIERVRNKIMQQDVIANRELAQYWRTKYEEKKKS